MATLDQATDGISYAEPGSALSRASVRGLALITAITCALAQALSQAGGSAIGHDGPWNVVAGQALWNAAQVGLLLLLLSLWCVRRRWWIAALAVATLACLPFAIYALSPGAWALTMIFLATCALAWTGDAGNLDVSIADAPARGTPALAKVELLALACYFLSSLYNYNASAACWPYWSSIYASIAGFIGFTADPPAIAQGMYTLGIGGVSMPPYITAGREGNNLGALLFLLIWTILPVLYILHFAASAKLAKNAPGTRFQQALCLFAIFHFLFLTDLVAYQYGRGVANPTAEWAHWSERFVWRLAILLPIYQKLVTGYWRQGNGKLGVVMHYGIAAWAVGFFVYQVVLYDLPRFYQFATGQEETYHKLFGLSYRQEIGYHGALVLMIALYGFMVVAMRCKRVIVEPTPSRQP